MTPINELIQQARTKCGKTQEYVAEKLGITQSYYSMIESGKRKPSALNVLQIEQVLELESGTIWKWHNIVIDNITENINHLSEPELTQVDEYIRFLMWRRSSGDHY